MTGGAGCYTPAPPMERIAADALQKTLLAQVIQQMQAAVIIAAAPHGQLLLGNPQVEKIWRQPFIPSASIDEYGQWRCFHADGTRYDPGEFPLARSLLLGETIELEDIHILRGDQTPAIIRMSSGPIRSAEGTIVAAVATFFDITDERREQEGLSFLAEASAAVGGSLLYDETLREVARLAIPKFADIAIVYLIDGTAEIRRHEVAAADPAVRAAIEAMWKKYPPSSEALRPVLESGRSHLVPRLNDALFSIISNPTQRQQTIDVGMRSVIVVPMQSSGVIFGVLTFGRTVTDRPYDSFDLFIAEEIGRRAAAAVERARLFEAEREQRIRFETAANRIQHLQTATAALSRAMTVEEVCDAAISEARTVFGATVAVVALVRGEEIVVVRAEGVADELLDRFRTIPLAADLPLTTAIRSGQPVWLKSRAEAFARFEVLRAVQDRMPSKAWASLPLEIHGRPFGALGLSFAEEQPFSDEDRNFLMSLAGQLATAMERARLFESERTSREEAEAASRAKDEFLAILSHELRTPMTTVIGWADFIKMTHGDDPSLVAPVEALRTSARTQAKLVDDLLDVSRIVTGKLRMDKRDTELTSVVRAAVESMRIAAQQKQVELVLDLPHQPVPYYGDPDRLQQIVTNLVNNGIKFTPPQGRVAVSVIDRGEEKDIVVEDTGEGISADFLPHVFDRFLQASVGDSRRHAGLGLGLSIVQHLAQMHGGRVRAESEGLGKGARFTVTLR
jgi:signal transduction histidine kinase